MKNTSDGGKLSIAYRSIGKQVIATGIVGKQFNKRPAVCMHLFNEMYVEFGYRSHGHWCQCRAR